VPILALALFQRKLIFDNYFAPSTRNLPVVAAAMSAARAILCLVTVGHMPIHATGTRQQG
jgi:hypothetical protein